MSRRDNEIRVTPSVFDRLIDYEPRMSQEPLKSSSQSLKELKEAVKRDLEWLLNSRSYPGEIDEILEEVPKSVAAYGLPDITGVSVNNQNEMNRLKKSLENAIKIFEPRFTELKVTMESTDKTDRSLKFKIEAFLDTEPTPEPITFDTVLELGSGDFEVKES